MINQKKSKYSCPIFCINNSTSLLNKLFDSGLDKVFSICDVMLGEIFIDLFTYSFHGEGFQVSVLHDFLDELLDLSVGGRGILLGN